MPWPRSKLGSFAAGLGAGGVAVLGFWFGLLPLGLRLGAWLYDLAASLG